MYILTLWQAEAYPQSVRQSEKSLKKVVDLFGGFKIFSYLCVS